jgi:hypothetical protein
MTIGDDAALGELVADERAQVALEAADHDLVEQLGVDRHAAAEALGSRISSRRRS